jgi:hypothetical protein
MNLSERDMYTYLNVYVVYESSDALRIQANSHVLSRAFQVVGGSSHCEQVKYL